MCREIFYISTVGLNEVTIKKYILEQGKHDITLGELSVREYSTPFKDYRVIRLPL